MIEFRSLKPARLAGAVLALALAVTPAFAVNKDMVQLQTQVQQLQDAVARLQQSNDERMGVLKDLVQQNADSVNKMSLAIEALQQLVRAQQEASGTKLDQVSGQMQSLNDSVDEVKARLNALEKALKSVQDQQQSINAALQNLAPNPAGTAPTGDAAPGTAPAALPNGVNQAPMQPAPLSSNKPSAGVPFATTQGPPSGAPPPPALNDIYQTALSDYMAAKYPLAISEFSEVVRIYPGDPLAGNACFYLGEIDYHAGKFAAAAKDYDRVLDQ
jgi:TolA-binding protein